MEKTTRSNVDKLDKYEGNYVKIKALFAITDDNFLEAPKYKTFLSKLERAHELRREIVVKQDKVRNLKNNMEARRKALEVILFFYFFFC